MKVILIISLLSLLITGCDNKRKTVVGDGIATTHEEYREIIIGEKEQIDVSLFVKDLDIIPLGPIPRGCIGSVDMLLPVEDYWLVVDKFKAKGIFLFDKKGNYVRQIGHLGKGPGEFIHISDVAIIPGSNTIAVLDQQMAKVNLYNLKGKFLSSEPTKYRITMLQYFNTKSAVGFRIGRFAYGGESEKELNKQSILFFNDELELVNHAFNDTYPSDLRMMNDKLCRMGESIYFAPNFENAIYNIKEDGIKKIYDIKFEKNGLTKEIVHNLSRNIEENMSTYNYFCGTFIELENYLLIRTAEKGIARNDLYDKKSGKLYYLNPATNSPLDDYLPQCKYYISENQIAAIGDPGLIMIFQNNIKQWFETQNKEALGSKKCKQLKLLMEEITENSNPVLFIYTLKENLL